MTSQPPSSPRASNTKLVTVAILGGLLLGAGVMTPFVISWRNTAEKARQDAIVQAAQAEKSKQEAIALEKQKAEMRENLGKAEVAISTLKTDLTARETALGALKDTDTQKTKEIEALRADLASKAAAMADLDSRLKAARSDIESATQLSADLNARINAMRTDVSRLTETVQIKDAEIAQLTENIKQEQAAKAAALVRAAAEEKRAVVAETKVEETKVEIMALAPIRIEERRDTLTKRKMAEKSGVPFGAAFDPIGDIFQGIGEGLFGKSGPIILVGVFKDGHEEVLTKADADKWTARGIRFVKLKK